MKEWEELLETENFQMEILEYPNGNKKYRLYAAGSNRHVILSAAGLCNQRQFRLGWLQVTTNRLFAHVNADAWTALVNQLLSEARTIQMNEDEKKLMGKFIKYKS
jgi:hypothetical protein